MGNLNSIQLKFDKLSTDYDSYYKNVKTILGFEKLRRLDLLIKSTQYYKLKNILDAGCGSGIALEYFPRHNEHFQVGLDISLSMLHESNKKVRNGTALLQADVIQLPFQKGSFDLVYALGVLDYLTDYGQLLKAVFKVLKPDGYFIFTYPNKDSISRSFRDSLYSMRTKYKDTISSHTISSKYIERIINQNGFRLISQQFITYGLGFITFPWSILFSQYFEKLLYKNWLGRRLGWSCFCITQKINCN